jgi:hypothetical protein
MTVPTATFSFPTTIRFGPGVIRELPEMLRGLGAARPLVVTDAGLRAAPIFTSALALLEEAGLAPVPFAEVEPNPLPRHVEAGAAAYRKGGCDAVVGFGGGSALDAAKAVALLARHPGTIADYFEKAWERVRPELMPPQVAVPTTAGTGSEVGRSTVITDPATNKKRVIFTPSSRAGCRPPSPRRRAWTRSRTRSRATARRPSTRSATPWRSAPCGSSPGRSRAP